MKTSEIRKRFSNYFIDKAHVKLPSSSLIPYNDATLLFNNAGMVPFKDFFTGTAIAKNKRITTIQKCVRAGGKHNDLENVGFTARHHTFFEMLGNFSFGDYFKSEAISFAWDFLTNELKIDKSKLYITVHNEDQEAADIWHNEQKVPRDRIFFRCDKENFWEMGELGPCGPSSEIFFDHGAENGDPSIDISDCILDDEDRYIEIWNLVFMQYEKYKEAGKIKQRPLPAPCVDTGAGLERIAAVMQGKYNNFDTDGFSEIIKSIETISSKKYSNFKGHMRVVADHLRAATMLITDGVLPSNEGRGYVLRRIIRRAVKHFDELGVKEAGLYKSVKIVFKALGEEYPDNKANIELAEKYLKLEEINFRKTLSTGIELLKKEIAKAKDQGLDTLSGTEIFKLYDTYGFPADLTELILREQNLKADLDGLQVEMQKQKERSKKAQSFSASTEDLKAFHRIKEKYGDTIFLGYENSECHAKLLAKDGNTVVFDKTVLYAESGGQIGDTGNIFDEDILITSVEKSIKPVDGLFVNIAKDSSNLEVGKSYTLKIDKNNRSLIARNHTATHLLQAALVKVLGEHIKQAGSFVGPDRLRFDFSHPEAVKKEELKKIEQLVNQQIQKSICIESKVMTKEQALNKGAKALFGEKYGDKVRVVDISNFSLELCGGTHVSNTNEVGIFNIVSEGSLATGVRRIEALSSEKAYERISTRMDIVDRLELKFKIKSDELVDRSEQLLLELKLKQKEINQLKEQIQAAASDDLFANPEKTKTGLTFKAIAAPAGSDLKKLGDLFLDKNPQGIVLIYTEKNNKGSALLKTFKGNSNINCSDLLKDILKDLDGRGGGKADMAQGSFAFEHGAELEKRIKNIIL